MFEWKDFWNTTKVYFTIIGVAITAFLAVGAIYLAWWINDGFGIILLILLLLLGLIGAGAILTDNKTEVKELE